MPDTKLANFPNRFQNESLTLINGLLGLTSSIFSLVSPNMKYTGIVVRDIEIKEHKEYSKHYMEIDPLNPRRFQESGESVVCLDSVLSPGVIKKLAFYQEFLKPNNYRYVADMFFRQNNRIIAVITMLRCETMGPFTEHELAMLRQLQPFLEYTLNSVYMPERVTERRTIQERYALTDRELDVLELIIAGASNKRIAGELFLTIATVKTHVHNIFQKTEVISRADLLSRVIEELKN